MKNRDRIGMVLYTAYLVLLAASLLILGKVVYTQLFFKPDPEIAGALTLKATPAPVEPARGNIIDCEGRMLAISYPVYQIYMDCTVLKDDIESRREMKIAAAKTPEQKAAAEEEAEQREAEWLEKAARLARRLPDYFPEKTAAQWEKLIRDSRAAGKKYVKIGSPVDRNTFLDIQKLPLFEDGRYKSGLISEQSYIRKYPYGALARRTIGFVRDNKVDVENTHIGLEGKYDAVLHGQTGKVYLRRTDHGVMRDNDSAYVKPVDGKDLRTTLNIDYQDLADKALREQIEAEDDLEGACVVLMDTPTGAIRAMVNLVRNPKTGKFEEIQNYAVGRKCEPGSVFKTVTLMSVLNDGYVKSLEETLPATTGNVEGTNIKDVHIPDFARQHNTKEISVIDGFKISSNYVFATLAIRHYGKDPRHFIENIYSYKLGEAFDFDLDGMATPTIASPDNRYWTNNDLGRVGFGYSTEETPLHILTFYNAIANKGKMMKPYLVEDNGPSILNGAVCSRAVADTLMRALKAVTEDGTARHNLKGVKCTVAGKTGTSFGTFPGGGYTDENGKRKYQGTFVGFFPADSVRAPKYSIICTVYSNPTSKQYQGGGIPARVTRTMVNGLVNSDPYFRETLHKPEKKRNESN